MENREFDQLLKDSLAPREQASEECNRAIIDAVRSGEKHPELQKISRFPGRRLLPKVAVIVLVISLLGTGTVYAANAIMKKIFVTEHGIGTGNEEYLKDEYFTQPLENVSVEDQGTEMPGPNDKWLSKKTTIVGGRTENVDYEYPDYATAINDIGFDDFFDEIPGQEEQVLFWVLKFHDGVNEDDYHLDVDFRRGNGSVGFSQSTTESGSYSFSYGIQLTKTANKRTYVSAKEIEFTLVDDIKDNDDKPVTYVMIATDKYFGYLSFRNLSEEEIHAVLDTVNLK
ncbi:MAG: hypothetical protein J6U66_12970 [Lachnospiraceae bacterium]|nr:hypothetical protein [Lachnospiraceae bacterium]